MPFVRGAFAMTEPELSCHRLDNHDVHEILGALLGPSHLLLSAGGQRRRGGCNELRGNEGQPTSVDRDRSRQFVGRS